MNTNTEVNYVNMPKKKLFQFRIRRQPHANLDNVYSAVVCQVLIGRIDLRNGAAVKMQKVAPFETLWFQQLDTAFHLTVNCFCLYCTFSRFTVLGGQFMIFKVTPLSLSPSMSLSDPFTRGKICCSPRGISNRFHSNCLQLLTILQ